MITLGAPPALTKDAAQTWKEILDGPVGSAVLAHLAEARPPLISGSNDINAVALAAAEAAGYEKAIQRLINLTIPPVEAGSHTKDAYPELEDDAAWDDGQELTKNKETPND